MTHPTGAIMRGAARAAAPALALTLLLAACTGATDAPTASGSPPVPASPVTGATGTFWLAGLYVAANPGDLDAQTARLAPIAGGALVVAPAACFSGLPPEAGTGYVLGVTAPTRAALRRLVGRTGSSARFAARTSSTCGD